MPAAAWIIAGFVAAGAAWIGSFIFGIVSLARQRRAGDVSSHKARGNGVARR